ncbi:polymer-forming cytoskeletal protein [Erythrobacter litoralis]|uniref:bactofilin family protein n=1 Tax=Erythrobacter litoralis TaxID=39960 RepID=UPI0024348D64|nr:polymer-forming cytoskeletal protein [Erythrobacter litoralis]MDG6079498.1 polymer-forming cytoskeletal protein [Erythrobacter litoralis]
MASKSNSTFSVLGSDLSITGDIKASADLHIDGNVDGDIACSNLVQGETSTVSGSVEAENARLAGTVRGSITARELVILKTAKITGDVFYDALTIEQGAQVEGRFAHRESKASDQKATAPTGKPELVAAG